MDAANTVGATTFATPSEREIVMTRVVEAPRRLVFEAWTNPEHLPHWMLGPGGWTMPGCEIDLRPGGLWHFVWRRSSGAEMEMRGVYEETRPGPKTRASASPSPTLTHSIRNTAGYPQGSGPSSESLGDDGSSI